MLGNKNWQGFSKGQKRWQHLLVLKLIFYWSQGLNLAVNLPANWYKNPIQIHMSWTKPTCEFGPDTTLTLIKSTVNYECHVFISLVWFKVRILELLSAYKNRNVQFRFMEFEPGLDGVLFKW